MKENSLAKQLVEYLAKQDWVSKGSITRKEWRNRKNGSTYIPATVDRELRKLEENAIIAVKYEGKNTLYKYIPQDDPRDLRSHYIPTSQREDLSVLFK